MRKAVVLTLCVILQTTLAVADLQDQLLAHYRLDGDAVDASGNGNDGVVSGAVAAADLRELPDTALAFDGIDDVVTVPGLGNWGDELSLSLWVYSDSAGAGHGQTLVGSRDAGSGTTLLNFLINVNEQGIMHWLVASYGAHSSLYSSAAISRDRWVHVVCDWSTVEGTMSIFFDGELVTSGPVGDTPRYISTDIGLGNQCDGCGSTTAAPHEGRLDEVRIYSRLLSSDEIYTLAGISRVYLLDGNAEDASGGGEHGTLYEVTSTSDRFGQPDMAYAFDGINDLIDVPSLGNWGSELGFAFWVYVDPPVSANMTLIGSRHPGSGATLANLLLQILADGTLRWLIYSDGAESELYTAETIASGEWVHVACDWSQLTGTMRIFVNGRLQETGPLGDAPRYLNDSIGIGNFGAGYDSTRAPHKGSMDDVRFYNRVFTTEEVNDLAAGFFGDGFESGDFAGWASTYQ